MVTKLSSRGYMIVSMIGPPGRKCRFFPATVKQRRGRKELTITTDNVTTGQCVHLILCTFSQLYRSSSRVKIMTAVNSKEHQCPEPSDKVGRVHIVFLCLYSCIEQLCYAEVHLLHLCWAQGSVLVLKVCLSRVQSTHTCQTNWAFGGQTCLGMVGYIL